MTTAKQAAAVSPIHVDAEEPVLSVLRKLGVFAAGKCQCTFTDMLIHGCRCPACALLFSIMDSMKR